MGLPSSTIHEEPDVRRYLILVCLSGHPLRRVRFLSTVHRLAEALEEIDGDEIAALPWGFSRMCRIRRLTGRIAAWLANVLNHYAGEIFLNQAMFEAGWEHGQLPTFDAATVTGDELVERLLQSDGSHRPAQVRRMSQMIAPRRLTFSSGEILERRIGAGGRHLIRLGMGQRSRGGDFALIWESVARDGNRQVDDLAVGQQLKGISGILTTGDGWNGIPEIVLDDKTFASATQAESLPAFDPKTLTGSDLVRMLSARKTSLTPSEVCMSVAERTGGARTNPSTAAK